MNIEIIKECLPFSNTEEAIRFGQNEMTEMMKDEMVRGQKLHTENAAKAVRNAKACEGESSQGHWEAASMEGFMAQLCRESVEAFEGKLKLRGQK